MRSYVLTKPRLYAMAIALGFAALTFGLTTIEVSADQARFEVASIKVVAPTPGRPQGRVGCFFVNPSRYTCTNASVSLMAIYAYAVKPYQIRPPVVEDTSRYNVEATVPTGTSPDQVKLMLQNLLADRFKLVFRRVTTEVPGYVLVVTKGGLKLKAATELTSDAPPIPPKATQDADGFTYFPPRDGFAVSRANGLTRWVGNNVSIDSATGPNLCGILNSITGQPVVDGTGLRGRYDLTLTFNADPDQVSTALETNDDRAVTSSIGLPILSAVEGQLGLKLDSRKIAVDTFVIEHFERTPVEN
jgi:uncharacterized protein (TIGR03435 family)